ncbi:chaperone protein / DnaJ-related protein [Galdieria sulphuraria]|uniref:Chaperone protein / DnaJ-related protein n=1 Tax=Galdieria sulphuraria TaxID=130081 RepID=M2Y1U0_GALSU|nr:chaperone protein / DnaJ-related protein [Galdieria sulphuraria]EME29898.1 chaperone protein / DnaJ-related protein [Galdieria sulphuraria]|eukprot:XP_005706418.1 chaperone protein / DnaJ-related protein [Galdieria sulphuraria]
MFVSPTYACLYNWRRFGKRATYCNFLQSSGVSNIRLSKRCSPVTGKFLVLLDYGVFAADSWMKNLLLVTGVATTLWFFSVLDRLMEERRKAELLEQGASKCPVCDGTGYIDCLCTKWSFPSGVSERRRVMNCTRCQGSLKERCPRCGGGGLLNPIPAPVRVDVS